MNVTFSYKKYDKNWELHIQVEGRTLGTGIRISRRDAQRFVNLVKDAWVTGLKGDQLRLKFDVDPPTPRVDSPRNHLGQYYFATYESEIDHDDRKD